MTPSDPQGTQPGASPDAAAAAVQEAAALRAALAHSQRQVQQMAALQQDLLQALDHDLRAPLRHIGAYRALAREALCALPNGVPGDMAAAAIPAGIAPDTSANTPPATQPCAQMQEALDCLIAIDQSAQRLARMLAATIALLRASQAPLRPQPIALHGALLRARAALPSAADAATAGAGAGHAIAWHLDPALPTLHADPALLHELLLQLLANAIKFTRHCAQPSIAVLPVPAAPGQLAFAVQDNGAGFDPAAAAAGQLFGLFRRLHAQTPYEGLGAGLALCRAIAQRHGGQIAASAAPGGGCTVLVHWPETVSESVTVSPESVMVSDGGV